MTPVRTFPIRLAPLPGEALDSWLEAMAHRMHARLDDLVAGVGLAGTGQAGRAQAWTVLLRPGEVAGIAAATGLPQPELEAMTLARYDGTAVQIDRPNRRVSRYHLWGRGSGSRYCPDCLASAGRWLLAWRLGWYFACLEHRRLLADTCPACGMPQRRRPHPGYLIPQPGRCSNPIPGTSGPTAQRCAADLTHTSTAHLHPGHPALAAQRLLSGVIKSGTAAFGVYASAPQPGRAALADVRALANRILGHATSEELAAVVPADLLVNDDCAATLRSQPQRRRYFTAPGSAAIAAIGVTAAMTVLNTADIPAAGAALRWLIEEPRHRGMEMTPSSLFAWGRGTSPTLTAVQLSGLDPLLDPFLRLRYRTATSTPRPPAAGTAITDRRARHTPSLLWPALSLRFALPRGHRHYLRRALPCVLLTVGTTLQLDDAASRLGAVIDSASISRFLRLIKSDPHEAHIFAGIVGMADYLDTHSVPIDYQRRRELSYDDLLPDETWAEICGYNGIPTGARKAAVARSVLFERISGLPARNGPFAIDDQNFRGDLASFPAYLTPGLADRLHEVAVAFLHGHRIRDEPVSWHPPLTLFSGLQLPGPDWSGIDISELHRSIRRGPGFRATADQLGTTVDTVRYLLEEHPAPRSRRTSGHIRPGIQATLHKQELTELYLNQQLSLRDIARRAGVGRQTVTFLAQQYDISLRKPGKPRRAVITRGWLQEQYVTNGRSLDDLARETGMSASTIKRWAHLHKISLRPRGGSHQPAARNGVVAGAAPMILRPAMPDNRGWLRLQRFRAAVAYPTLAAAACALGLQSATLASDVKRLECDLGGQLLVRARRGRPMKITEFGIEIINAMDLVKDHTVLPDDI
jgi:transposase-like protein